jgi:hypothetical protein
MTAMTSPEPILAEITVPVRQTKAFVAFTAQMGEWWDALLSPDAGSFRSIEVDPEGDVATVHEGRDNHVFGRVTTWQPSERFGMDFWLGHSADQPTQVDVAFDDQGEETQVRLVHDGWTDATADARDRYTHWDDLLERYAAHVIGH